MLRTFALFGIVLAVFASCGQASLTAGQRRLATAAFAECCKEMGVPPNADYFEELNRGGVKMEDRNGEALVFCAMLRLNFVNREGVLNKRVLVDFFTEGHDVSSLPGIVDECDRTKKGSTVQDRSYSFYRCFFDQKKFIV